MKGGRPWLAAVVLALAATLVPALRQVAAAAAGPPVGATAAAGPAGEPAAEVLKVGSITLHRCETAAPWCGNLSRPLDPTGGVPGTISHDFHLFRVLSSYGTGAPGTGAGARARAYVRGALGRAAVVAETPAP